MAGEEVGDIFTTARTYDVNVWSTPETRDSLTSIRELLIDTPSGEQVRLADVADVQHRADAERHQARRTARAGSTSSANVQGRDLGSVVARRRSGAREDRVPAGVPRRAAGRVRRAAGGPAAPAVARRSSRCSAIFLLLQVVLRQLAPGDAVLPDLAVGAGRRRAGGVFRSDGIISLGSLVGFLTVLGIAARNGIMLISHYQHLEQQRAKPSGRSWSCAGRASGLRRS